MNISYKKIKSRAAMLWDESYLWGLMSYCSFKKLGLDIELISSNDIKSKDLSKYCLIYVPGGWASNKKASLGEDGIRNLKEFIASGGNYFGICGGAGLATTDEIGIIEVKRRSIDQRVPSLSGRVRVNIHEHKIWKGIIDNRFYVWWPSQFLQDNNETCVLADFIGAEPEAFTSDFNIADMELLGYKDAEANYNLNLDPGKMNGDAVVLESNYGKGKVLISLLHFDTPEDKNSEIVMRNIWKYFDLPFRNVQKFILHENCNSPTMDLFDFGVRNFLWIDRPPLINWRRGIRGFEYYTLHILSEKLFSYSNKISVLEINSLKKLLTDFSEKARQLLIRERFALQKGEYLTFSESRDPKINQLRRELFSDSKSYGGFFKEILDKVDALLFKQLKSEN